VTLWRSKTDQNDHFLTKKGTNVAPYSGFCQKWVEGGANFARFWTLKPPKVVFRPLFGGFIEVKSPKNTKKIAVNHGSGKKNPEIALYCLGILKRGCF
jgi:hypothetical protein